LYVKISDSFTVFVPKIVFSNRTVKKLKEVQVNEHFQALFALKFTDFGGKITAVKSYEIRNFIK
jgi:hypothetical protein